MVFQTYALYPHMTVAKNIAFPLKMAGEHKATIDKKVANAARILNLTAYLERRPGQLSGGQRQRVAIGRAIVRQPSAFLFDEPLSNLDAALRGTMRLEISELHQQLGTTMIYVTHDQVEAMTMADKIVVLNARRIEQVGSPMELYRSPKNLFVAGFIGSPKMNLVEGAAAEKHGAKTIGVRPEHVAVSTARATGRARWASRSTWARTPSSTSMPASSARSTCGRAARCRSATATRSSSPRCGQALPVRRVAGWRSETCGSRARSALITGAARGHRGGVRRAPMPRRERRWPSGTSTSSVPKRRRRRSAGRCMRCAGRDRPGLDRRRRGEVVGAGGRARHPGQQRGDLRHGPDRRDHAARATSGCSQINVAGALFMLQAAARQMIAQGRGGKIINMASQAGRRGEALVAVYCATKAAVISLTQSAGLDLIRHGINVNAIAPGVVEGEHWDHVDALFAKYEGLAPGEKKRLVGGAVPYGRMGTAEDLTGMAVFLARAEADYIVAQTYNVDGGQWMS